MIVLILFFPSVAHNFENLFFFPFESYQIEQADSQ